MTPSLSTTHPHMDLHGLADLRALARRDGGSPETVDAVARQFEALFIHLMLKSMREAVPVESGMDSEQVKLFQGMYDQQIALEMSGGQGMGLREALVRELTPPAGARAGGELRMPTYRVPALHAAIEAAPVLPPATTQAPDAQADRWMPKDAEAFVRDLWPHARRVGERLGVAPQVLIAQSALETGWGRHVMQHGDGRSSHNLFGIKADARWPGERVQVTTLEYVDGLPERQRAAFRSYSNLAQSFDDYADFLQSNPRYRDALAGGGDPEIYLRGLQAAGYATDPAYADKILAILERGSLRDTLAGLKSSGDRPTT